MARERSFRGTFASFLVAVLSVCYATDSPAQTLVVNAAGTGGYPTIQAAVDAAGSGDELVLEPGIYSGLGNRDIDLRGKLITVCSTSPDDPAIVAATIIDCGGTAADPHRGFHIHSGETRDTVVLGLTITNGFAESGGAICCENADPTIDRCIIRGNSASGPGERGPGGGGIACGDQTRICACIIADNSSSLIGGGVKCGTGNVEIIRCLIAGNRSVNGGGISCQWGANASLSNCTIVGNKADQQGGGLDCLDSNVSLTNCILWNNSGPQGSQVAGMGLYGECTVDCSYCDIQGRDAGMDLSKSCRVIWGIGNMDVDPSFVDSGCWDPNGTGEDPNDDFWLEGDYHLQSQVGRWDPNTVQWIYDAETSLCIDAGNPADQLDDEPADMFNVRVNMGAYGGTALASRSPARWAILADLSNDRLLDFLDFAGFAQGWLDSGPRIPSDLDRDGVVGPNDLAVFGAAWLSCAASTDTTVVDEKSKMCSFYTPDTNSVEPNAPGYALPLNVEDIWNWDDMGWVFPTPAVQPQIEQNGFAVIENYLFPSIGGNPPDDILEGVVMPYEGLRRLHCMLFITSDTLLHIYHIQFDETLKEIEEAEFIGDIDLLTKALLEHCVQQHATLTGNAMEAAGRNVAFFSVAAKLIDPNAEVPAFVSSVVDSELQKIDAHAGFLPSNLFIYEEDYSQYVPRGHYTRSEALKRYFKTMMWYGRMAFILKGAENWGPPMYEALVSPYDARIQTLQGALIATAMNQVHPDDRSCRDIWDRIYAVTSFYVGTADDLTPYEYAGVITRMFGDDFCIEHLDDETMFVQFRNELTLLRSPAIYGGTGQIWLYPPYTPDELDELLDKTKGLRFMGQRYIPDSYMFQQLVFPEVLYYTGDWDPAPFTLAPTGDGSYTRGYPRGLDVMAVLGSTQAENILLADGDTDYVRHSEQYASLKAEFDAFDAGQWNQNLYWSWLYSLQSLLRCPEEGYPPFMRTDAWQRKQLNAALASWTELRHDTILYAKQSYTAGGKGGVSPPPTASGYVEPVPEFYRRLGALTDMTLNGLNDLNVLSVQAQQRLVNFKAMLNRLTQIADKELVGEELSDDDFLYIGDFAATLEQALTGSSDTGISTVLVADVHTNIVEEKVVEEAVGKVDILLVACPLANGSIILAAGPALSYYEFKWPMADRLTDDAWRSLLDSPDKPSRPSWYQPYLRQY